ncbi:DUF4231 domain-containing protein [Nocardiopsis sp. RSe5-2]|uniref:DUF4231 domain-containing protein n=1 Tax=Nocardiopsis endophytica TaxID=3018445 RepID=A0ABT4U265_9ACTN|nr:DUF4231 domain-containing protein [Nocardiopsis endophytica]MDA2811046.1 DUF4231 domain-containing protein [Nocardiopsis endophytica]
MTEVESLRESDLPGLYQAAASASSRGRRRYELAIRLRLGLVVAAAVSGMLASLKGEIAAITALAFFGALLVEIYVLNDRPDLAWYEGRALAETVKSLTWRYAVGAAPFAVSSGPDKAVGGRFRDQISRLLKESPQAGIAPTESPVIGDRVQKIRARPVADRRAIYLRGRVVDQQRWYAGQARIGERRATAWRVVMLLFEVAGFLGAVGYALGAVALDLSGTMAALVGAGAAWTATRRHDLSARTYSYASNELSIVRDRLEDIDLSDEACWADTAAEAENVITSENAAWRAARSPATQ